MNKKLLWEINL